MSTATRTKQVNVGLPEPLYEKIKALAEGSHRTMVGTIAWLYAEHAGEEAPAPAQQAPEPNQQPQAQPA